MGMPRPLSRPVFIVGLLLSVSLFVASAASFLRFQSIWIDETTQMSGLALGFGRLFPWLMGQGPDLGVPPDRMPPLSYLLGMLWGGVGSMSETSMRWFGVCCSVVGVLATALAARRAVGPLAALVAAVLLLLSPTLLAYAPEIRAYPLLFMFAASATYAFIRALQADEGDRTRWLAGVTAALVLTTYTHYFGVVLAAALLTALLVDAVRFRKPVPPVLLAGAAVAVLSAGIVPFVAAAVQLSGGPAQPIVFTDVVVRASKLVYRLYGHPALANSTAMTAVASAGFGLLLLGSVLAARRMGAACAGLLVAAVVGLAIVVGAAFATRTFDTLAPQYNLWLLPIVVVLLSRGAVGLTGWRSALGAVGLALLVAGCGYAVLQIHARPGVYAHGPQRQIIALLDALGPSQVDIVYETAGGATPGHLFFPFRYHYGTALPQYKAESVAGPPVRFDVKDPVAAAPSRSLVMVIDARDVSANELARRFKASQVSQMVLPAAETLKQSGWQSIDRHRYTGLVTANLEVLKKAP